MPTTPRNPSRTAIKPGFTLTPEQRAALNAAKAWWQEGDRHLDYLAERAEYRARLEQVHAARERLHRASVPTVADAVPFLRLARTIAPRVAVNRARETDDFARALQELLFGEAPLAERLAAFLGAVRGVGALTASLLLYVAFPDRYPFVTDIARAALTPAPEQKRALRSEAEKRFGATDDAAVAALLVTFTLLDEARRTLALADFADLDAVLRHAREMPKGGVKRARRTRTTGVQEAPAPYTPPAPEPTEADLLRYLEGYVAAQGFTFPPLAVRDYYLALKTKPFVILAGLSGTGKTRLTELIAEALTGNLRSRYRLFPVRPDWTDAAPLLGYHNALTGAYIGTPFLELLHEAARPENRQRAYFVCLDEMNLARTEHYLADILSAMETRERTIPLAGSFDTATLPANLFLSGTVNIEEGTHPFGLKVLDRANVIEFSEVNLARATPTPVSLPEIAAADRERLFLADRLETVAAAEERLARTDPTLPDRFTALLTALNDQLAERGLQFGYRVRDESLRYLAHAFTPEGAPLLAEGSDAGANFRTALDLQIVQKVLPRLSGTEERVNPLLTRLARWAEEENLPRTAAKLLRMRRRATEEGIVSFWE